MRALDKDLVQKVARAICARVESLRSKDDAVVHRPDDLVWLSSEQFLLPVPRWKLYEDAAQDALQAIELPALIEAILTTVEQVVRGRSADPIVIDRSFDEIEKLARESLALLGIDVPH